FAQQARGDCLLQGVNAFAGGSDGAHDRRAGRGQRRGVEAGRQVRLVGDDDGGAGAQQDGDAPVVFGGRFGEVNHPEDQIRRLDLPLTALDADPLDDVGGLAQAGGVDSAQRDAPDVDALFDDVARGAGDLGDDGAALAQESVQQAGLADVGPAGDDDSGALAEQPAGLRRRQQPPCGVVGGAQAVDQVGG